MKKKKKIKIEDEKSFDFLMAFKKYRELRDKYEKLIDEFQRISGFATDTDRRNKMLESEKELLEKEIKKLKATLKKYTEPEKISKTASKELKEKMPKIPKETKCKTKKSSSKDV